MNEVLKSLERHMRRRPPSAETANLYLQLLRLQGMDPARQDQLEKDVKALNHTIENLAAAIVDIRNTLGVAL